MPTILHIPFAWQPDPCGGTEVYVRALIRELAALGWAGQIAVPAQQTALDLIEGTPVHRVRVADSFTQAMLYGAGDPVSAAAFSDVLETVQPDLVHFHAYSPAISVLWLQAARARGIPCLYTYHTPTLTCGRGTLMRWGTVPCDGQMTARRCAACTLHGHGLPQALAWTMTLLSPLTQRISKRVPFRALPLVHQRQTAVRQWLAGMAQVVALCAWGQAVLQRNAVPSQRLRLIRHGLTAPHSPLPLASPTSQAKPPLRLAFFGRLDPTKGLQVLVAALQQLPHLQLELHCHLVQDPAAEQAMDDLLRRCQADSRIHLHPAVAPDAVVATMATYDAVAVPSIWLETGPLVVLEAFAAGRPVLGSALGGIAEWVQDGVNGLLIPPNNVKAWAQALVQCSQPNLLAQLHAGISPPRTMQNVAADMLTVYQSALLV